MDGIQESLRGQTILITGATGFMGKVLIEKLLRCVDFKHMYLLLRPKRGVLSKDRITNMLSLPIFAEVNATNKIGNRISVIDSDMSVAGLGLTNQDAEILTSEVNVIFHVAANVKFDQPLKDAFNINVRGTKELMSLSLKMNSLKAFVYVSTAYSQHQVSRVDERIYDCSMKYDKLLNIIDSLDDSAIESMTPKILGTSPNTYCFTKALAESVIAEYHPHLPLAIFRPGIVASSYNEPLPGWVDNFNGPTGLVAGAYCGVVHVALIDSSMKANDVPVDMADNALIAIAAELIQRGAKKDVPVYNYVAYDNVITYHEKRRLLEIFANEMTVKALWVYVILTSQKWLYLILSLILHYIPGMLMDIAKAITEMKRPKTFSWELYRKYDKAVFSLNPFACSRKWDWETTNVRRLWTDLSQKDKQMFRFNMGEVNWADFYRNTIMGVAIYLLKEDRERVTKSFSKQKKLTAARNVITIGIGMFMLKFILSYTFVKTYLFQLYRIDV